MSFVSDLNLLSLSSPSSTPKIPSGKTSLQQKIAQATIEGITALNNIEAHGRSEFATNNQVIHKGVWYPSTHRQLLNSIGITAIKDKEFLQKKDAHICGHVDAKFFQSISDSSPGSFNNKRVMHFLLKDDVLPVNALKAAMTGLSIIDCGVACQIARYHALLAVLGQKKFNILFGNSPKGQKMNVGYTVDDHLQPMQYFVNFTDAAIESVIRTSLNKKSKEIKNELGNRPVKIGQLVEIKGVATYPHKHPWGCEMGYNLICTNDTSGQQRFTGLGIEGTEEAIDESLVSAYNKDFNWDNVAPGLRNNQNSTYATYYTKSHRESLNPQQDEGFNSGSVQDYNFSLIQDLIDLPKDQISMDYVKKHKSQNKSREEQLFSKVLREA